MLLGLALAVLPVLLVRTARPVILVRFPALPKDRIALVTTNAEFYLCGREAGVHPKAPDLFYYASPIYDWEL